MLDEERTFVKLELRDIDFGKPLPWTIYNGDRVPVRRKGEVIRTRAELDEVMERGAYRLAEERTREGAGILLPEGACRSGEQGRPRASAKDPDAIEFENSRIRIGDPLVLQAETSRYTVRLIGYLRNRSIIVTPPEIEGDLVMIRDGQAFFGRFFSGRSAFAFNTSVLRQTSVPYPHVHLAYPRETKVQVVRHAMRVDVGIIAVVSVQGQAAQASGKIVNLSPTGAGLRSKAVLGKPGDILNLKFRLVVNGIEIVFNLDSEVRNAEENLADPALPFMHGLHFLNVEGAMHVALSAFVYGALLGEA